MVPSTLNMVQENWGDFEVSIAFGEARYRLRIHEPSQISDKRVIFVEDERVLPGRSLKLSTDGDHYIQVFPDDTGWRQA